MRRIIRGGAIIASAIPSWIDPSDTDFSKRKGGRWNPSGEFGALYLNRSLDAALANAHRHIESLFGDAATLYDFLPEALPDLQHYDITKRAFVDIVTPKGIASVKLSEGVSGRRCAARYVSTYCARRLRGERIRRCREISARASKVARARDFRSRGHGARD